MTKTKKRLITVMLILLSVTILTGSLFVYAFFVPYGRHVAENTEVLKVEKIIEPPDSVAIIRGGIATEVSEEKRDQIYAAFAQAFTEQKPRYGSCFCSIGRVKTTKCNLFNFNVEFRYNQRRQAHGYTYDAVLLSFNAGNQLIPIFSKNGKCLYHLTNSHFWFDKDYFTDFKKTIKGII
jgi:hypothetical protein